MFTGIIQAVGEVVSIKKTKTDMMLVIDAKLLPITSTRIGDSIAVNGVCLTVVSLQDHIFTVDVSHETIEKTNLSKLKEKSAVNLEKALTLSTPLGGHLVSGHIDGIGHIEKKVEDGKSTRYYFTAPKELMRYIAPKGSITVEGISLTVNHVSELGFDVSVIPHTESSTNLGCASIGDEVNLEVDLVARYVERLLMKDQGSEPLVLDSIRESGL